MRPSINGHCDKKFEQVYEVFEENILTKRDVGASFAVTIEGEMVVDLWGGHLDVERTQPWKEDTIVNVYSTTKTMAFLCALVLADRGQLDLEACVSDYWPEFAVCGKREVKVWHILNHAAGLSGMDVEVSVQDLYNSQRIARLLQQQTPWWEPGTKTAYHALTQGYLLGELVRRITGISLGTFFREEIAEPLDADFYIGVPDSEFGRIGDLIPPGVEEKDDDHHEPYSQTEKAEQESDHDSIAARTFRNPAVPATCSSTDEWRRAEIPAGNGHGNARSVTRIQTPLACMGSAFGVDLLSPESASEVMKERISGIDLALGIPLKFGLGFAINSKFHPISPNKNTCYWGGWGGSIVVVDQDAQVSASYVMNKMFPGLVGDMRAANLLKATYAVIH